MVLDPLGEWDLVEPLWNNDTGIVRIHDVGQLVDQLDLDREFVTGDPASFVDESGLVVPWRVSKVILERVARRFADRILPGVEEKERKAQEENRWGYRSDSGRLISPEICAKFDADYKPARDLVRQWCGTEAQERYDELAALRVEVVRLGRLIERAISAVREAGDVRKADDLERELGIPLDVLRRAGREDSRGPYGP